MSRTFTRRLLASAAICVATMAALPAAAWAHIDAEEKPHSGGTILVTFTFIEGCKESPTTSLRVQLPAGATEVKAQDPTGWTSTVSATELNWTGGSIPNGTKGDLAATMKLTGKDGDTVFFPTIQGCPGGLENTWIDKSGDPEAENAAPRITLAQVATAGGNHDNAGTTEKGADAHDHAGGEAGTTAKATTTIDKAKATGATVAAAKTVSTDPASSTSSGSNTPLIIGGIVVLLLIVAGGGFALSKRGSSRT